MTTLLQSNTLEAVLRASGDYPADHVTVWAEAMINYANTSPMDNALVGFLIRRDAPVAVRDALAEMPLQTYALCLARMVVFGMTEDEIKRFMPQKGGTS